MRWFKIFHEARTDAKLKSLTDAQFRVWFNLLSYSSEQPIRGTIQERPTELLAIECAGGDVVLLIETLERLEALQIVTMQRDATTCNGDATLARCMQRDCNAHATTWALQITFKNFEKRQVFSMSRDSSTSTERSRNFRERKKMSQTISPSMVPISVDNGGPNLNSFVQRPCNGAATTMQRRCNDPDSDPDSDPDPPLSPPFGGGQGPPQTPPLQPPQPPPPSGTNGDLDHSFRECLGDRFDLEDMGPKIHAWMQCGYAPDRIRNALMVAVTKAPHGSLARYALGCLRNPERELVGPNARPVSRSEATLADIREWAEEERRRREESNGHG